MKKSCIILTTAILLNATTIVGIGEDKKEALSDLSNQLSVNVKSEFKSYAKVIGKQYKKIKEKEINLISNLPIKGVRYQNSQPIKAILSSNAIKVYKEELIKLKKEIDYLKKQPKTYENLTKLLKDINSFNKNKIVAVALGATNLPNINITKSQVEISLQKITKKIKSLKIAAKIVASKIDKKNIYISFKPYGSNEVTQFASIFKSYLSSYLNVTKKSDKANYFLRGNYKILKNSIFVTFNLLDKKNNIIKTITLTLDKQAYKDMNYKPHTQNFDMSLINGFVKKGSLSVKIGFKGYNREDGIDLKVGDKVDIVVKTNKPICYFLVGYVLHKNKQFAYLIPVNGDEFINKITGNDVNTNMTIIEDIEVSPPVGRETLQIFASTLKNGKCPIYPPKCEENDEGYCVIKGKTKNVIIKTRGLLLKHKKQEKTEASITWTSFNK
jgi:hypothetical protein